MNFLVEAMAAVILTGCCIIALIAALLWFHDKLKTRRQLVEDWEVRRHLNDDHGIELTDMRHKTAIEVYHQHLDIHFEEYSKKRLPVWVSALIGGNR